LGLSQAHLFQAQLFKTHLFQNQVQAVSPGLSRPYLGRDEITQTVTGYSTLGI